MRVGIRVDYPHMTRHPFEGSPTKKERARADVGRGGNEVFRLSFFSRISLLFFLFFR